MTIVPVFWSFIGGSAAFLLGVHADLVMPLAGAAMVLDVLRRGTSHPTAPVF